MEKKQKPRRPRAIILPSGSTSFNIRQNPEIIGCAKRKIDNTDSKHDEKITKKQKVENEVIRLTQKEVAYNVDRLNLSGVSTEKFPKEDLLKVLKPVKTYGVQKNIVIGRPQIDISTRVIAEDLQVSNIFGNERESLIGTSLLELSTEEQIDIVASTVQQVENITFPDRLEDNQIDKSKNLQDTQIDTTENLQDLRTDTTFENINVQGVQEDKSSSSFCTTTNKDESSGKSLRVLGVEKEQAIISPDLKNYLKLKTIAQNEEISGTLCKNFSEEEQNSKKIQEDQGITPTTVLQDSEIKEMEESCFSATRDTNFIEAQDDQKNPSSVNLQNFEIHQNEEKNVSSSEKSSVNTEPTESSLEVGNEVMESEKIENKDHDSSQCIYKPNESNIFSSQKLSRPKYFNKKELQKLAKNETIIEIDKLGKPVKVIIEREKKKEYGINWDKYIDQNVSETNAQMYLNRHKRSLSHNLGKVKLPTKDTEQTPTEENSKSTIKETDKLQVNVNIEGSSYKRKPKMPFVRKVKYGKKETQNLKQPKKHQSKLETYKNDSINQIEIQIESEENPDKKINKNKVLLKFFQDEKYTIRMMKRVNFILKMIKEEKIIVDIHKLIKAIRDNEIEEGIKGCVDRKSIHRLLGKLNDYGLIKYRKANLKSHSLQKTIQFICDPSYNNKDDITSAILEDTKIKFFYKVKECEPEPEVPDEKPIIDEEEPDDFDKNDPNFRYDRTMAKKYGYCPKFARCRKLHELLFYLVYENQQEPIMDPHEIDNIFNSYGGTEKVFENCNPAPPYIREISWKTFLSPIRPYQGYPKGWIIIGDILLRLPLTILASIANIPYEIPMLEEYLKHPVKKYFLFQNVPNSIRKTLTFCKRLTTYLIDNLRNLCYLGLVQFGPQISKDREQIYVYVNQKATLYNTVKSAAGYHQISEGIEYRKMDYIFESGLDLEQFWYDMWSICANTSLGHRSAVAGEYIVLEAPLTKAELVANLKPRQPDEAPEIDNGNIPGDKRGAAGFDSCLFLHLKRNWSWVNSINTISEDFFPRAKKEKDELMKEQEPSTNTSVETKVCFPELPSQKELKPVNTDVSKPKTDVPAKKEAPKFKIKPKIKIREVQPYKSKVKKVRKEYDEIDKICLSNMRKLRTDWTEIEDHINLLCAIASQYLCPNFRKQCIEPRVFRDVLQKIVPHANDKTSKAVQRRVRYILKNPNTFKSFTVCLEEIKHCGFIEEKFGTIVKKYQKTTIPSETLRIAFVELVGILNEKFNKKIQPQKNINYIIPNQIEELKTKFNMVHQNRKNDLPGLKFNDVQTAYDIECDTVRSVIHSSLCSSKDKTSWAFQLFKIYQQYPESMLRQVISKIRYDQLASMKKAAMLKIRSSTSSILQSPLKLSLKYQLLLQNSQFRYDTLLESNNFLMNFIGWLVKEKPELYDITCSDHGVSLILENVLDKLHLEPIFEHPEQIIILDPILKADTTYERILKKYHEILKAQTNLVIDEPGLNSDSDEENIPHIESEPQMCNTEIKNPSRIGFHMMRAEMLERNDKNRVQHMHDYFVVQASKVFLQPTNIEAALKWYTNTKNMTTTIINEIKTSNILPESLPTSIFEEVKVDFSHYNLVMEDLEYIEKVKCQVHSAKELGLTISEIKNISPDCPNVKITHKTVIKILEKYRIIIRIGITCLRFVHYDFKKPWVTHADKILRLEKEKMSKNLIPTKWKGKQILKSDKNKNERKLKILVAPWVRLDGSLNRRVLDRWLGKIISTCVEAPCSKLQDLILKMHLLKPTETIFLVEQLVKIGGVRLIKVKKPKITLFSEIVDYDFEETDILEDPNEVLIEPTKDAFLNFAAFVGAKIYGSNFID